MKLQNQNEVLLPGITTIVGSFILETLIIGNLRQLTKSTLRITIVVSFCD